MQAKMLQKRANALVARVIAMTDFENLPLHAVNEAEEEEK